MNKSLENKLVKLVNAGDISALRTMYEAGKRMKTRSERQLFAVDIYINSIRYAIKLVEEKDQLPIRFVPDSKLYRGTGIGKDGSTVKKRGRPRKVS